jgi:hypothetical protein
MVKNYKFLSIAFICCHNRTVGNFFCSLECAGDLVICAFSIAAVDCIIAAIFNFEIHCSSQLNYLCGYIQGGWSRHQEDYGGIILFKSELL